jgi:hypothetical protein
MNVFVLTDQQVDSNQKVIDFLQSNPINEQFYKKERNRLPASVFKPTSAHTFLLKSVYKTQPQTIFFAYPEYITRQRKEDRLVKYKKS